MAENTPTAVPLMYSTTGGMGPNIVMNFTPSYGYYPCIPVCPPANSGTDGSTNGDDGGKEEECETEEEVKTIYVQGNPTFKNPRVVANIGQQRPKDPCLIM